MVEKLNWVQITVVFSKNQIIIYKNGIDTQLSDSSIDILNENITPGFEDINFDLYDCILGGDNSI